MRICERFGFGGAVVAAAALLAACDPATMAGSQASRARLDVAGQTIVIAAPAGYCIDPKSTTRTADGAFVLLSDCSLFGAAGGKPDARGSALTASVSSGSLLEAEGDAADGLADLEAFAASRRGRAVLSRSGQPDRVRILNTQTSGGVLYVLVEDRGRLPIAGLDRQFWRAFLEVNGRTVALSDLSFQGGAASPQGALNRLAAFARAIQSANPHG